jgi:hypothetical protein
VRRLATLLLLTFVLACKKTDTTIQQAAQDTGTVAESSSTPPVTFSERPATSAPLTTDTAVSSTMAVADTAASGFPDLGTPPPNAPAEKLTPKPKQAYVYLVDTFYDWPPNVHAWVEKSVPALAEFDSKNRKNIETLRQKEGYKRTNVYSIFGVPVPPGGKPHPLISFRHTVVIYQKPAA